MRGLAIDARYRVVRNLVRNPSAATLSGLVIVGGAGAGGSATIDATVGRFGASSMRFTTGAGVTSAGIAIIQADVTLPVGVYVFSAHVKSSSTATSVIVVPFAGGSAGVVLAQSPNDPITTDWTRRWVRFQVTTPGALTNTSIYPAVRTSTAGVTLWTDGVMLTEGPTLYPYVDGDQPNAKWDGTPGASTSRGRVFIP